jgi:phosphotransferase system HPr (HPr) family protein
MVEKEVELKNPMGLHARPAVKFVQKAAGFVSDIRLVKNGREASAKSISKVLTLKIRQFDPILIRAEGPDEAEALDSLVSLLENALE